MEASSEVPKFCGAGVDRLLQPAQWPLASDLYTSSYLFPSKGPGQKYQWDFFPRSSQLQIQLSRMSPPPFQAIRSLPPPTLGRGAGSFLSHARGPRTRGEAEVGQISGFQSRTCQWSEMGSSVTPPAEVWPPSRAAQPPH